MAPLLFAGIVHGKFRDLDKDQPYSRVPGGKIERHKEGTKANQQVISRGVFATIKTRGRSAAYAEL